MNPVYPNGVPDQTNGAAGENDCSTCHFGELGNGIPELRLEGLTDRVRAGSHLLITLHLSHADMQVAGIQASIRSAADSPELAGQLQSQQLKSFIKDGIAYLNHPAPLEPESGTVMIVLEWDVPLVSETAVFTVAMVAGNKDFSPFGDSVVKLEKTVEIIYE